MKKYFFKILMVFACGASIMSGTDLNAQAYYQTGVDYVYRSLKDDDDSKTSILNVQFNAAGVATITRTEENSQTTDGNGVYLFGQGTDITVSSSTGDPTEIEFNNDGNRYWLISMDNPDNPQQLSNNGTIKINCTCKRGSGTCSVSSIVQSDTVTSTCVTDAGCNKCKISVENEITEVTIHGGMLIIKAQNVVIN